VAWNTAEPLPSGRSIEQELPLGHVKELPRIVPLMVTTLPSGSLADIFRVAPLTHHPVELSTLHETLPETDGGLLDGQSQSQAYSKQQPRQGNPSWLTPAALHETVLFS
jgi:hypothetical protein